MNNLKELAKDFIEKVMNNQPFKPMEIKKKKL